jgi:hypothetical protein
MQYYYNMPTTISLRTGYNYKNGKINWKSYDYIFFDQKIHSATKHFDYLFFDCKTIRSHDISIIFYRSISLRPNNSHRSNFGSRSCLRMSCFRRSYFRITSVRKVICSNQWRTFNLALGGGVNKNNRYLFLFVAQILFIYSYGKINKINNCYKYILFYTTFLPIYSLLLYYSKLIAIGI